MFAIHNYSVTVTTTLASISGTSVIVALIVLEPVPTPETTLPTTVAFDVSDEANVNPPTGAKKAAEPSFLIA